MKVGYRTKKSVGASKQGVDCGLRFDSAQEGGSGSGSKTKAKFSLK